MADGGEPEMSATAASGSRKPVPDWGTPPVALRAVVCVK